MKEPFIAIIIANYNGRSYLYKGKNLLDLCIKPLLKLDYKNYKIIVTDDCSKDDSISYIKKNYKSIDVTKTKENGRFAKNNNNGIRYAIKKYNPDYVLLISNDVISKDNNWLKKLVDVAESRKEIGLVGPKLIYPNGRIQSGGIPFNNSLRIRGQTDIDRKEYSKIESVEGVIAVMVLIKRSVINKIGLLDENFHGNFEDVDYCLRTRDAGFDIIYDGQVKLIHLHSYTNILLTKTQKDKFDFIFEEQKNCAYFMMKHYNGAKIIPAYGWFLFRTIIVHGEHGHVGISNFKIEGPVVKKLGISMNAWKSAEKLYNSVKGNKFG